MSLSPEGGGIPVSRVVRAGLTLHPIAAGVPRWAAPPLQHHLSPQCGEGTPQATGFFEVMVAGKLVHSKKVWLSVCPSIFLILFSGWLGIGISPLPSSSTPQRGDGYVDTESKFLKLVAAVKAALAQG